MVHITNGVYFKALSILKITEAHSVRRNARIAAYRLKTMNHKTPLTYKVACKVLICAERI